MGIKPAVRVPEYPAEGLGGGKGTTGLWGLKG